MGLATRIIEHDAVLYVFVAGKFDLIEAKRSFLQVMEAVKRTGAAKVLIDGRQVSGEPTVMERYFYGEFIAHVATWADGNKEPGAPPKFSYALLHPTLDPRRLGETVAANRGMNVRAFDNLSAAASWLEIDPAEIEVMTKSEIEAGS
jgi:hypothetical protein